MTAAPAAWSDTRLRAELIELAPVLRRTVELEPGGLARIQRSGADIRLLVHLPFGVLVARTITVPDPTAATPASAQATTTADEDVTFGATTLLAWIDDPAAPRPARRDAEWRSGSPPTTGWQRVETVPDSVVRGLVRSGALALQAAAAREGVPGSQPRAEVADALLNSIVLTVSADRDRDADADADADADPDASIVPLTVDRAGRTPERPVLTTEVNLRALSALTRMGFLPRDSHVAVDVAGRWTRIAAAYGSVFLERPGAGLGVLRL